MAKQAIPVSRAILIIFGVLLLVILSLSTAGCSPPDSTVKEASGGNKLKVYTSFYPLYDFTRKIGGDQIEVVNLIPAGTEPHDWEPSPRTLAGLSEADLFVYNGAGFEPWVDKFLAAVANPKLQSVEASRGLKLRRGRDPHVWLNPLLAREEARQIKEALVRLDPRNRAYYEANFATLAQGLEALDRDFAKALAGAKGRELVVAHDAFGYLADRYGLTIIPIMGLSPEGEPSPADLARLAQLLKEKKIGYIFFEELVSPKVAKVLAREVGAATLVLNPVEGLTKEQEEAGMDYFSLMYQNLGNLKIALETK